MSDSTAFNSSNPDQLTLQALDRQIQAHKEADAHKSLLDSAIGWAVGKVWNPGGQSLSSLETLSKQAHQAEQQGNSGQLAALQTQMSKSITSDKGALSTQSEVEYYTGAGLKTAALFLGGGKAGFFGKAGMVGLASTVGLYAADNASVSDSGMQLGGHLLMGGLKGGLTKGAFHVIGESEIQSPMLKGILMGGSARGLDLMLSPSTYTNAQGQTDVAGGFKNALVGTFDPRAMGMDAVMFGLAGKLTNSLNEAGIARPFYNTVLTSGTLGVAGGSYNELHREMQSGQSINIGEILKRGLLEGGVYGLAGVPGGLVADPVFRQSPLESVRADAGKLQARYFKSAPNQQNIEVSPAEGRPTAGGHEGGHGGHGEHGGHGGHFNGEFHTDAGRGPYETMHGAEHPGSAPLPEHLAGMISPETGHSADYNKGVLPEPSAEQPVKAGPVYGADGQIIGFFEPPVEEVVPRPATDAPTAAEGEGKVVVGEGTDGTERPLSAAEIELSNREVGEMLKGLHSDNPPTDELHRLYTYLAQHPEVDPEMSRLYAENVGNAGIRRAIEGFYKPSDAIGTEPTLKSEAARAQYQYITDWLETPTPRRAATDRMANDLRTFIENTQNNLNIDLRPALEQHARLSRDPVTVRIIDRALGTNYEPLTREFGGLDRSLPQVEAVERWKQEQQFEAGVKDGTQQLPQDVLDAAGKGEANSEAVQKAAAERGVSPDKVLEQAQQVNKEVADAANVLKTGNADARAEAARQLRDRLNHPGSADWFDAWRDQAAQSLPMGGTLELPAVKALPDEVLHDYLSGDWTKQYNKSTADEIWRARMRTLSKLGETFGDQPETLQKILQLGKDDPFSLDLINKNANDRNSGNAYKQWLGEKLADATSLQPLVADGSLGEAALFDAFKDSPETAQKIKEMAAADPQFPMDDLLYKLGNRQVGRQLREVVQEHVTAGDTTLNLDMLMREASVRRTYGRDAELAQKIWEIGKSNPEALDAVLKEPFDQPAPPPGRGRNSGPPPRDPVVSRLNGAYRDVVTALAPQAESIQQLADITNALKAKDFDTAWNLASKIRPADNTLWQQTELRMDGIASKTIDNLPAPPPKEGGRDRGGPRGGDRRGGRDGGGADTRGGSDSRGGGPGDGSTGGGTNGAGADSGTDTTDRSKTKHGDSGASTGAEEEPPLTPPDAGTADSGGYTPPPWPDQPPPTDWNADPEQTGSNGTDTPIGTTDWNADPDQTQQEFMVSNRGGLEPQAIGGEQWQQFEDTERPPVDDKVARRRAEKAARKAAKRNERQRDRYSRGGGNEWD